MNWKILVLCLVCSLVASGCKPEKKSAGEGKAAAEEPTPSQSDGDSPASPAAAGLEMVHRGVPLASAQHVVVLFHGYGADMHDLAGFSRALDAGAQAAFVFPQAPTPLSGGGYRWFQRNGDDFEKGVAHARDFVGWVSEQAPQAGLVIGGFSQGAMLTANLVADAPANTEAALIFSGSARLLYPPTEEARKLRVFISHGTSDGVIPFADGQTLHERFSEAGFEVTWTPFEGEHRIPKAVLKAANAFLEPTIR